MNLLRIPLQPILVTAAIVLAAVAQTLHVFQGSDDPAVVFFAAALVFWLLALVSSPGRIETAAEPLGPQELKTRRLPMALVVSSLGLALLTFFFAGGNAYNSDNVLAWLGCIAAFLYSFWIPQKDPLEWRTWLTEKLAGLRRRGSNGVHLPVRSVLLIGVILLTLFFDFYNLAGVPAEMESDHAENVLDVNDVINGARPIFFERNAGREPLAFYATAALVAVTQRPLDFTALKLVSAASGVLLVWVVFLLARELFEFDVALAAAALAAIGKWPVSLARLGLGFVFVPLAVALTVYFLFRALKSGQRNDFLATGLFLGLGLYGSDAFRFAPLVVLAFLVLWYAVERRRVRLLPYLRHILLMFALAVIVALPLIRYAIDQPSAYWYHTLTRLGAGDQPLAGIPLLTFAGNFVKAVLMFNWVGDGTWLVNVPGDPALDLITGSLFLLGLAFALYRLLRFREKTYLFVLAGLLMMLVPSALSLSDPAENPSSILASGAIPFVFILAALPVVWGARVVNRSMQVAGGGKAAAVGFLVVVFAFAVRANFLRYFVDFDSVYRQASWNSTEIAAAIGGFDRSIGDAEHAWLIAYPYWVDARNVGINMGQPGWQQTLPNADAAQSVPPDAANKLYILHSEDRSNLARLEQLFPQGQPRLFHARTPGHDFVLFYVPGTGSQSELFSSQYFDQGN